MGSAGAGKAASIAVVGLGPGDFGLLTAVARQRLGGAERIFFRTLVHPTVAPIRAELRAEQLVASFDGMYEQAASFDELYETLAERLLSEARQADSPIVYAVPGHPMVGERSVARLLALAPARGVAVEIVDGLSFLEPLFRVLRLDPLDGSLQIVDGASLEAPLGAVLAEGPAAAGGAAWEGLSPRLLATDRPLLIGQIYDRQVASTCKMWLLERYPPTHQVQVAAAAGTDEVRMRLVELAELDHRIDFDHLTSLYVPPLARLADPRGLPTLPYIVARLRAPDGCPWDREQTWDSLKPHLLEEAYEAVAALDAADADAAAEELGDVLGSVVMLAQIGAEQGLLDLPTVLEAINGKLIRRHPHVFGDLSLGSAGAVVANWERIKSAERPAQASALSGVPLGMPALIAAQVMGRKAAALGFDWQDIQGVWAKLQEEIAELEGAATSEHRLEEVGDLLFTVVSLCRHLTLDAEEALRRANAKFRARFGAMERDAAARGLDLATLAPDALDTLWRRAKIAASAEALGNGSTPS